jgi:hypothetical protein
LNSDAAYNGWRVVGDCLPSAGEEECGGLMDKELGSG